jgi:antitoxin CptB
MLNAENLRDAEHRRFAWRCRRGMLELDIVLQNFVSTQFNQLNLLELQILDEMLALPDTEFWGVINQEKPFKKTEPMAVQAVESLLQKLRSVRLNAEGE